MIFVVLPLVLSSAVKSPVSSITVIPVGCGITQLRVIVSTGSKTIFSQKLVFHTWLVAFSLKSFLHFICFY